MYNVLLASNKIAYRVLFRKMLELHCNEQYVSFSTAKDGFEGIEKITNGEYTLVIIDINDT
ncbi:hypothetical protein ACFRCQ_16700 [Cytobacillus firmus]|uniref:hypothetical protein n=1 Tax=Cytobacillus firmus TaxID=1399 RepID=UPI0036BFA277